MSWIHHHGVRAALFAIALPFASGLTEPALAASPGYAMAAGGRHFAASHPALIPASRVSRSLAMYCYLLIHGRWRQSEDKADEQEKQPEQHAALASPQAALFRPLPIEPRRHWVAQQRGL